MCSQSYSGYSAWIVSIAANFITVGLVNFFFTVEGQFCNLLLSSLKGNVVVRVFSVLVEECTLL
jgi:hypothetical protein